MERGTGTRRCSGTARGSADRSIERVAEGTTFEGHHLQIRPSIGIGIQRGPHYDAMALMRCADEAMYASKNGDNQRPQVRECNVQSAGADRVD